MTTRPVRAVTLGVGCLLAVAISARADISNITIPNFSFETNGPNFEAPGSSYADQNDLQAEGGYSPYPYGEIYSGWENQAGNRQIYSVSTSSDSGTFDGADAVQINGVGSVESLNPVTTILDNATYKLTFALSSAAANSWTATLEMFATTQGPDTNTYTNSHHPDGVTSPYPAISNTLIASQLVTNDQINSQGAGVFKDYSVSFDTLAGDNSGFVGKNLSIALAVNDSNTLFDNARLTVETVPEPSTYAMMIGAMALLGFCVRRRLASDRSQVALGNVKVHLTA